MVKKYVDTAGHRSFTGPVKVDLKATESDAVFRYFLVFIAAVRRRFYKARSHGNAVPRLVFM